MTLHTALQQGADLLEKAGVEAPRLTAEVLLCHALHQARVYLYAHPEKELREVEWIHYGRYLHERSNGKPTQYITLRQEFYGREFHVTPDVLIPRPETELLVEQAIPLAAGRVVDVGCGSGAIAVTLALETRAVVIAVDVSAAALRITEMNAGRWDAPLMAVRGDLLSGFGDGSLDLVVSNPPYVASRTRATLQREVRDHEPAIALFAGEDGLEIYRRLIPEAWRALRSGGSLALELGFDSLRPVRAMAPGGASERAKLYSDLAGIGRVIVFQKP